MSWESGWSQFSETAHQNLSISDNPISARGSAVGLKNIVDGYKRLDAKLEKALTPKDWPQGQVVPARQTSSAPPASRSLAAQKSGFQAAPESRATRGTG